jgi:hypothetical protein
MRKTKRAIRNLEVVKMPKSEIHTNYQSTPTAVLLGLLLLFSTANAYAGIHTWDVVEVFSNFDGTIQYVELLDVGATGTEVGVGNGSLTSSLHAISWANGAVTPPTAGKSYLIATAAFAALPGAPPPDVIIPAINVPFFNTAGDTVSFAGVDALVFGAVPTNGTDSLDEATGVGANTPKNYAGFQGNVTAGGPPKVPTGSALMILMVVLAVGTLGIVRLSRGRLIPS